MEPTSDHQPKEEQPKEQEGTEPKSGEPVADNDQQAQWRQAYIQQQQRRNCPGCGDGDEVF
jgi:hypothetical protein